MKIKLLSLFIFLTLVSGNISAREFSSLFEVVIDTQDYTNINNGLNKAFDKLLIKLTGSRDSKYRGIINQSRINKTEYVSSYTIEEKNDSTYLKAVFNQKEVLELFDQNNFPILGFNRPDIILLIYVDDGLSTPYYLTGESNQRNNLEIYNVIQDILSRVSESRGVFLDLPFLELQDLEKINQALIYDRADEFIANKFINTEVLSFNLVRSNLSQWTIFGDISSNQPLSKEELIKFLEERTHESVDQLLRLERDFNRSKLYNIRVEGLNSFNDYLTFENEISKIFTIQSFSIAAIKNNQLDINARLRFSLNELIREFNASNFFKLVDDDSEEFDFKIKFDSL
tara:strand:- start:3493 stop:4518 length:1026 start_codon:yes stop_codon:yes gene_type:complete